MPVDFTDYTDPGIYIEMIDAPITSLTGVTPTVIAIVGEGSGAGRKVTESTVLRSQATTKLNAEGLDPTTVKVKNRFSGVEYASAVFGTVGENYGTASTAIGTASTAITVTLSSNVPLPDTPFVIRLQDEYMNVTDVTEDGNDVILTVERGTDSAGASDGSTPGSYNAGLPVNLWVPYGSPEEIGNLNHPDLASELPLNSTVTSFYVFISTASTLDIGNVILVDNERMLVTDVTNGGTSICRATVQRGVQGTRASAHGKIDKIYRIDGFDYFIKMDAGSNADFDGIDDHVVIGCIPEGRLALLIENDEVVANAESVEVSGFSTNANQYAAELMTDLDDVKDKYGLPTVYENGTTIVNSPITLAAQLAFANGARQIYCVAIDPTETNKTDAFNAAVEKLAEVDTVNVIVPLTVSLGEDDASIVFDSVMQFINNQATLGRLMRAFIAYDGLAFNPAVVDYSALAQRILNSRISVVAPSRFKLSTPTGAITVGGPYAAAAVAGLHSALEVQEPLTRKNLEPSLLFSVTDQISTRDMLDMQSKGVLVLFNDRSRRITVRHGLTTDMTDSYSREISVVAARDRLRDLIYDTLQTANLLGSPITSTTPDRVVANVTGALESAKRAGLIFDYADIKYRIPNNNPTAIEIRFAYRPTMPLNYVLIQFSVDTVSANVVFDQVYQGGVV